MTTNKWLEIQQEQINITPKTIHPIIIELLVKDILITKKERQIGYLKIYFKTIVTQDVHTWLP